MSDRAALIIAFTLGRPMCLPCIATQSEMSLMTVMEHLDLISKELAIDQSPDDPWELVRHEGQCSQCGDTRLVAGIGDGR
jgi:hypothetical protein